MKMEMTTKKLVTGALFLALTLVMPFLTGQIPGLGSALLPMHLPVLLCGFVCGGPVALLVGLIAPILRSMLFSMPPMFPTAMAMAFELAAYGFFAGFFYSRFSKKVWGIFASLIAAMLCGRVVWGAVSLGLYTLAGKGFGWQVFAAGAFVNAIPGIVLQLVLIPILVVIFRKIKVME